MKEKIQTFIIIACLVIGISALILSLKSGDPSNFGYSGTGNVFSGGVTNSSTTVATSTATSILARNTDRQYAAICNDDATNPVYIHFASATTSVAVSEGYKLLAKECYEINIDNLYLGQIYGLASGGTVVVTTLEK